MVRTRIAPSPTGIPHIGNTRTALFNYLWAKKNGGKFILRIEDTDQKRIVPGALEAILEILKWLELNPDEIYTQSERLELYKKYAKELVDKGLAYADDGAIRFKMPKTGETSWQDAIGYKAVLFDNRDQEDFIILKTDGFPTYHLASVIDDHEMQITHVLRGDEWISSTPKHIQLYKALGWETPVFAHLPVILGHDKTKLSKRHGAESVLDFRKKGFLKEALINFMALLGWSPSVSSLKNVEFFTLKELEEIFDLNDINTGSPVFDLTKLEWMNGVYIRELKVQSLKLKVLEYDSSLAAIEDNMLTEFLELAKTRIKTLKEFKEQIDPFLNPVSVEFTQEEQEFKKELKERINGIEIWTKESIGAVLQTFTKEKNIRFPVLYKIIIAKDRGLPLAEVFEILGKEKTLSLL